VKARTQINQREHLFSLANTATAEVYGVPEADYCPSQLYQIVSGVTSPRTLVCTENDCFRRMVEGIDRAYRQLAKDTEKELFSGAFKNTP
jgi:hypothetical protein